MVLCLSKKLFQEVMNNLRCLQGTSPFELNRIKKNVTTQSETVYMGVSKNRGTPEWTVYTGKPY